jgi:hypothetical protein
MLLQMFMTSTRWRNIGCVCILGELRYSYLNLAQQTICCLVAWVGPSQQYRPHTKKASQPGWVGKLKSSFPGELGPVDPAKRLENHARVVGPRALPALTDKRPNPRLPPSRDAPGSLRARSPAASLALFPWRRPSITIVGGRSPSRVVPPPIPASFTAPQSSSAPDSSVAPRSSGAPPWPERRRQSISTPPLLGPTVGGRAPPRVGTPPGPSSSATGAAKRQPWARLLFIFHYRDPVAFLLFV